MVLTSKDFLCNLKQIPMEQNQPTLDKIFKCCTAEKMEATKQREVAGAEE
jgi:hypothetical protein